MGRSLGRSICNLLLLFGLCFSTGCFGVSQNPSYFPHLLSTGDIIRTHAKPPLGGYYDNFDPHAVRLEVRPLDATNPVRSQHVIVATVYDEKGEPRRDRRVEWMLEGVGNIVEVDESGFWPGRGYKVDNRYAVSYTSYGEHRITRGNANPNDDFVIRPGQTWCVVSSAVEGDTHVTAYAPGIANWDNHKVFVTTHWLDAEWVLPPAARNPAGAEHVLTTNVFRHTDRQPLANYRVRYRILDGPPAVFLPQRTPETVVTSDLRGNAITSLVQVAPAPGVNHIGVEVIRPPDPTAPSGVGIVIGKGVTTKEWLAAQITLNKIGPATATMGQEIPYTLTVTNNGQVDSQALTIRDILPEGVQYVRSEPRASIEGPQLVWTFGTLAAGQAHTVQLVLRATRVGEISNCASVTTVEGVRDEKCVTTRVSNQATSQLSLTVSEPPAVGMGVPVVFQIGVANTGTGPATHVMLSAAFDAGLEHETRANPLELPLATLAPGETRTVPLTLVSRKAGRLGVRFSATADGNLRTEVERSVTVQTSKVSINKSGPRARYVDSTATWDIAVENPGDVALANVIVRDVLAPEVTFLSANSLGQFLNGEVVWNLGTLAPRDKRLLQVTVRCARAGRVVNAAIVTADPGLQEQSEATLEILGIPAFALEITKTGDPALVGGKVSYRLAVTNTGSLPANGVELRVALPKEFQIVGSDGPIKAQATGNLLQFPAKDGLQPKQTWTYTIEVQAQQAGDVRIRAELRSTALREPVVKEESTLIYPPTNGGLGASRPAPTAQQTGQNPAPAGKSPALVVPLPRP